MNDTDTNSETADTEAVASIDFAELTNIAMERIAEHAITHPLRTLGIAAGVGYTLGRGVPTFMVRIGMIFGARLFTNALLSASLEQLGSTMRGDDEDPKSDAAATKGPKRRTNGRAERKRANTATADAAH
jgi:hypothetical protein